jgi:hypothetical protein
MIIILGQYYLPVHKHFLFIFCLSLCIFATSCKKHSNTTIAFYYWKTSYSVDTIQRQFIQQTNSKELYLRFFDVEWDTAKHQPKPNAAIQFQSKTGQLYITPVIYITNKTFEKLADTSVNTLARHCSSLLNFIAHQQNINYSKVQIDCDWSLTSRDRYFSFLKAFKKINQHQIEATIRLHQVKYRQLTGVPSVDKGVLMFYNMGKVSANPSSPNSIYNYDDAAKYLDNLDNYPLPLDVALPLFSWSLQIRDGHILHLNNRITRDAFSGDNFSLLRNNIYRAKRSFFFDGVYVKENDIFKLEDINAESLEKAARQLSSHLSPQQNRAIIFYELGNINPHEFTPEQIRQVSDRF